MGYLKCRDQDIIAGYDRCLTVFNLGLQPCFGVRATLILWDLWLSRELCYCHFIVFSYKVIFWDTSGPFLSPGPYLRPLLTLRRDALGVVARWSSLAICRLLANAVSVRLVGTRPDQRHLALPVMGV